MKTIVFDERCANWTENIEHDLMFLSMQADYIKEIFVHRGYMYLNQIYEYFGVQWKPNLVNSCYLLKSGPIEFEFEPISDVAILVKFG
jgi:hypothetical protein